mgnify:CR=1 FL=1
MKNIHTIGIRAVAGTLLGIIICLGFSGYANAQLVDPNPGTVYIPTQTTVTTTPSSGPCTVLSYNLFLGQESSSVLALQSYLQSAGYMTRTPTGYYGPVTFAAVVRFQASQGISRTGTAGPLTRARIQALTCGSVPVPTPTSPVTLYSITPNAGQVGSTVTLSGAGFNLDNTIYFGGSPIAHIGNAYANTISFTVPSYIGPNCPPGMMCTMIAREITPGSYQVYVVNSNGTSNVVNFQVTGGSAQNTLSIAGIDAPNSLPMSVPGTWTVRVVAGQSSNLHYSVLWGDEAYGTTGIMAPTQNPIASSATFTHTYYRAGTFNPTFTVSDDFGHTTTLGTSIIVTPMY